MAEEVAKRPVADARSLPGDVADALDEIGKRRSSGQVSLTDVHDRHPASSVHRPQRPDIDGYPYTWHSLALEVTQQHISAVELRLYPSTIPELPSLVLAEPVVDPIAILREDLLGELDLAGCRYDINDRLTFGRQSSIIVPDTGVTAVFSLPSTSFPAPHPDRHYLDVIYKR